MNFTLYLPTSFWAIFEIKLGIFFPTLFNWAIISKKWAIIFFSSLLNKNAVLHHLKFLRKFYPEKRCPIHAVQPLYYGGRFLHKTVKNSYSYYPTLITLKITWFQYKLCFNRFSHAVSCTRAGSGSNIGNSN